MIGVINMLALTRALTGLPGRPMTALPSQIPKIVGLPVVQHVLEAPLALFEAPNAAKGRHNLCISMQRVHLIEVFLPDWSAYGSAGFKACAHSFASRSVDRTMLAARPDHRLPDDKIIATSIA